MTAVRSMSERQLQDSVVDLATLLGFLSYHTYDSRRSEAGYPDLTLIHPRRGRSLFRELKSATGRVTAAQSRWLSAMDGAGFDAAVWRPADWPDRIRTELLAPQPELSARPLAPERTSR